MFIQAGSGGIFVAPDSSAIVDVNLSPFSVGSSWSLHPALAALILFGWMLAIVPLVLVSPPLALAFGVVSLAAFAVTFVITAWRRLSSSTTGRKSEFISAGQLTQRPATFDRTFGEIIQTVDSFRPVRDGTGRDGTPASEHRAGASKRTHAIIYVVLGVLILVIGLPVVFALRLGGALLAPAVVLVVAGMYAMFTRARRVLQPSADLARQGDPRPPILFLRSFQDDKFKLKERVRVAGLPTNQPIRMEEALAIRLRDFGPFLAVGEPGEGLPQLGAARAYLSDQEWQNAVLSWIKESRLIAMLCGPTRWIHWEMQNIIQFHRLDRVLLLLPPGRKPGTAPARRRQERWDNIVRSLEETPYATVLRQLQIDDILLVQFRPHGSVRVFRSSSDLVQDYELALTLAVYSAFTEAGPEVSPPAVEAVALTSPQGDTAGWVGIATSPRSKFVAAKIALFGLAGGIVASLLAAGPTLDRWVQVTIRSLLLAAAVTAGAWLFYNKGGRFLGWLFGCIAVGYFVAANAAFLVASNLIPRGAMRVGIFSTPFVITWLLIPLCIFAALSLRFRGFRHARAWAAALAAGVAIGLLAPLGFSGAEGLAGSAIRFTVVPWAVLAACIGFGLSVRDPPW
jgi:hypothetical protein